MWHKIVEMNNFLKKKNFNIKKFIINIMKFNIKFKYKIIWHNHCVAIDSLHFHTEYKIKALPRVHMLLFNTLSYHNALISHRVIILEDDLEKLMVAKETEEMTCAGYQDLRERLQLLQPHMQASTCCWDDTLSQVDRMLRRVSSPPGQRSSTQLITTLCCCAVPLEFEWSTILLVSFCRTFFRLFNFSLDVTYMWFLV